MEICIEIKGIMKDYFPTEQIKFRLKDRATLADLYSKIGESFGEMLPNAIWNREKNRFRGPVLLISNSKLIKNETTQLQDGQKIEVSRYLVGG